MKIIRTITFAVALVTLVPIPLSVSGDEVSALEPALHKLQRITKPDGRTLKRSSDPVGTSLTVLEQLNHVLEKELTHLKAAWEQHPSLLLVHYNSIKNVQWVRTLLYAWIGKRDVLTALTRAQKALRQDLPFEKGMQGSWLLWSERCYVEMIDKDRPNRYSGCAYAYEQFGYGPYDADTARVVGWLTRRSMDLSEQAAMMLKKIGEAELDRLARDAAR